MAEKIKRKRGGQQDNQNARKHGFYSANLTPREICEFWNILNLGGIAPELAVLRLKLESALRCGSANPRLLSEASRLLVKWYRSQYRLDGKDNAQFKIFVRNILPTAGKTPVHFAGTNRS